jgi:hypothetical protein
VSFPGAVYRCQAKQHAECEVIDVDRDFLYAPDFTLIQRPVDILSGQWLGSSVSATEHGKMVVCAHRYGDRTRSFRQWYPIGQCTVVNWNTNKHVKYAPCKDGGRNFEFGVRGISYCQAGTSVKMSKDGSLVALGGPGAYKWQGISNIVKTDDTNLNLYSRRHAVAADFDYLGYSTDIGQFGFEPKDKPEIVVGAPRYNDYFGRVAIFNYDFEQSTYVPVIIVEGQEFASYFGHSVAVADLNNDGRDDLLVGAPFFSGFIYNQGRVYVYLTIQKDLELNRVLTGTIAYGQFGYSLSTIGDLNGDSFEDVVISAPYGSDGGAVYVYHGSLDGIVEPPSQIIEASSVNYIPLLGGFGTSLSGGMDMDDNGYPDLLVGAYTSERAVLLRSRPIADVLATLSFRPQFVNYPNNTILTLEVCIQYDGISLPGQLSIAYNISVEESRVQAGLSPRTLFVDTNSHAITNTITTQIATEQCTNFTMKLLNGIRDLINPIQAILSFGLASGNAKPPPIGDPDFTQTLVPVIKDQTEQSRMAQAYLLEDCGQDVSCIPDLQVTYLAVTLPDGASAIVLSQVVELTVSVSVRNIGENAYLARLIANFEESVTFIVVIGNKLVSCVDQRNVDGTTVTCDIGNPLRAGASVEFGMRIGVHDIRFAGKPFVVSVQATSENAENNSTLADNIAVSADHQIIAEAKIGVEGVAFPERMLVDLSKPSVDVNRIPTTELHIGLHHVNHTFVVINDGPSSVEKAVLTVQWPGKVTNNRYLLYIMDIRLVGSGVCQTQGLINPANLTTVDELEAQKNQSSVGVGEEVIIRQRRNAAEVLRGGKRTRRAERFCPGSTYLVCYPIVCELYNLDAMKNVELHVISRLYERTLIQDTVVNLTVTSHANIELDSSSGFRVLDGLSKSFKVSTRINEPESDVTNEPLKAWVIVVVIVVMVLLLIGTVALLGCLGFFKRTKKDQLEKEKEEMKLDDRTVLSVYDDSSG